MKDESITVLQRPTMLRFTNPPPEDIQTGRTQTGRFAVGNKASVGHGGRAKRNLFLFRSCFSDQDIEEIAAMLLEKAKQGDLIAIKLLLTYILPAPSMLFTIDDRRERQEQEQEQCERLINAIRPV
ncbi:MAG: hypothetical protein K5787_18005 [Lentisphaeria bacterium]|nr:hypothetical protein [Lentisphaeria bacterium]